MAISTRSSFIDVEMSSPSTLAWSASRGQRGEVINVCTGEGTQLGDVLSRLIRIAGVPVEIRQDPARRKPGEVQSHVGNPAKLRRLVSAASLTPLEVTLARIYRRVVGAP